MTRPDATEHMKEGEAGAVLASTLERVDLGSDDDGDEISSCVVVASEAGAAGPKLTKTQRFAFDALKKTIADQTDGIAVQADSSLANKGIPIGARACLAEAWRRRFYDTYPADKLDTKKKALLRATLDLEEAGLIGGGVTGGERTGADLGGPRETDCVPGHIGLEPANPGAGHLIGFA